MATYWHGWHESDPPSPPEEITRLSLQTAWEEELLAEQDVADAEVSVSLEHYETLPDHVAKRLSETWERVRDGRS